MADGNYCQFKLKVAIMHFQIQLDKIMCAFIYEMRRNKSECVCLVKHHLLNPWYLDIASKQLHIRCPRDVLWNFLVSIDWIMPMRFVIQIKTCCFQTNAYTLHTKQKLSQSFLLIRQSYRIIILSHAKQISFASLCRQNDICIIKSMNISQMLHTPSKQK